MVPPPAIRNSLPLTVNTGQLTQMLALGPPMMTAAAVVSQGPVHGVNPAGALVAAA